MTKNTNEQLIQDNYRNVYALAHSLAKSYNLAFEAFGTCRRSATFH